MTESLSDLNRSCNKCHRNEDDTANKGPFKSKLLEFANIRLHHTGNQQRGSDKRAQEVNRWPKTDARAISNGLTP